MDMFYTLDAEDRILRVSTGWNQFSLENGGPPDLAERVVGAPLETFISGDETRAFFHGFFLRVREMGRLVWADYRCDSPELKRLHRMMLTPRPNGTLTVTHVTVWAQPQSRGKFFPVLQGAVPVCSLCGRLFIGESWVEVAMPPAEAETRPLSVHYVICDSCRSASTRHLRQA